MSLQENNELNKLISLSDATEYCFYSQEYLSLLARRGKLRAEKIGRVWHTKLIWLFEYIEQNSSDKRGNYKGEITSKFENILIQYNVLKNNRDKVKTDNISVSLLSIDTSGENLNSKRINRNKEEQIKKISKDFDSRFTKGEIKIRLPSFFALYKDYFYSFVKEKWDLITGKSYQPFKQLENKIILDLLKDDLSTEKIVEKNNGPGYRLSVLSAVYAKLFIWKESLLIRFQILKESYLESKNIFLLPAVIPTAFILLTFLGLNFSGVNIFQNNDIYTPHKISTQIVSSRIYISKQFARFDKTKINLRYVLAYLNRTFRVDYRSSTSIAAGNIYSNKKISKPDLYRDRYVLGTSTTNYWSLWKRKLLSWMSSLSKFINYSHQVAYKIQEKVYIYRSKNTAVVKSAIDREYAGQTKETNITAVRRDGVIMIEVPRDLTDEEIIYEIANRFSDNISVDFDKIKRSGIIWPNFRDGPEEGYIYLIIN